MASDLIALATLVADGDSVDWATEASSADAGELDSIEQMRILAEIARVHRASRDGEEPPGSPAEQTVAPAQEYLFDWGPLRVLQKLGSGSFGDVFRAWDTSLDREVALKVLRQPLPSSRREIAIIREGQMLARISHPNVMTVYGALAVGGKVGIWGEFLRGRTLAKIVEDDGPLGAQEATIVVEAVSRALSAVHRSGLLHRDIKAQNVMRETGGRIVLMDFGLGREVDATHPSSGLELAGTPAYLAPELLDGIPASPRSDVYSTGVLLFFLLTGSFPIEATSLEELVRAHRLGERRRLQDLRSDLPSVLGDVVDRALVPDPAQRFESAGALQARLAAVVHGVEPLADTKRPWRIALAAGTGLLIGVLASVLFFLALGTGGPPQSFALSFTPPPGLRFTQGARSVPAVAPDGKRVAFVATDATGVTQLWVRRLGESQATPVAGSLSASGPFWSPDGQSLAFFTSSGLHKVSLSGARSEKLVEVWENRGATWGGDLFVLAARHLDGLWRLSAAGGALTQVTKVNRARAELAHMWPQFLPDGRILFFLDSEQESVRGAYIAALDGTYSRLIATDASALYSDGQLFFVRDSTLYAQPFDLRQSRNVGSPVAAADHVGVTYNLQSTISASTEGTLVYAHRARDFRRLVWYDLQGREMSVVAAPEKYRNPTLSRDGRFLAVEWYDALSEIRIFDLVRGGWTTLRGGYQGTLPAFGPGHQLAVTFGRGDLYKVDLDSQLTPTLVFASAEDKEVTDWSSDGKHVVFASIGDKGYRKLWVASATDQSAQQLIGSAPDQAHHEVQARFSPDGRSIAYLSSKSGVSEVYARTPWDTGLERKISIAGGYNPVWRSNRELLYLDRSGTLYSATVVGTDDRSATSSAPQRLFRSAVDTPGASRNHYVLSPEGTRVLFAEPLADASTTAFAVLVHWRGMARASQ